MKEMFSIIYTPTEGEAIENYSRIFRRPTGCFLNIENTDRVHNDLAQWGEPDDIDYIVVTGKSSTLTLMLKVLTLYRRRRNSWNR